MNNRQLFLSHLAQTTDFPLMIEIEKAEGVFLYGPNGEKYMDLISGIGVSNIGHRHPNVLAAIHDQLDKYLHLTATPNPSSPGISQHITRFVRQCIPGQ